MSKKILILGGGPGGCMTANHLARLLKEHVRTGEVEINLLSNGPNHVYEAGFLFMALDLKNPEQFTRKQAELLNPAVHLIYDPAAKIEVHHRKVITQSGNEYAYDVLLIATGSEIRPDLTQGMVESGDNFYTLEGTKRLRDKLISFAGGKIVCAVEVPHKCPVAFLEILFMLRDFFRVRGISDKVELAYTYPLETIHQKPEVARFCEPLLTESGIRCHTGFAVDKVDPSGKVLFSKGGVELRYDLLISIPTHRAPRVILESGLGDPQGWIDVNPTTLQITGIENAYAIGDATNLHMKGVPKAGSAAHYQSEVVAKNMIQELNGLKPNRFYDGKVFCFLETSLETASCIQFDYRTPAAPPPPSSLLHWFKLGFNELYWTAVHGIF